MSVTFLSPELSAAPRSPFIIALVKNDEPISSDSCEASCEELEER